MVSVRLYTNKHVDEIGVTSLLINGSEESGIDVLEKN